MFMNMPIFIVFLCILRDHVGATATFQPAATRSNERQQCKVQVFTPAHGTPIRIKRHTSVATRLAPNNSREKTCANDDVKWISVAVFDFNECHVGMSHNAMHLTVSRLHSAQISMGLILLIGGRPDLACQRRKQHQALFKSQHDKCQL